MFFAKAESGESAATAACGEEQISEVSSAGGEQDAVLRAAFHEKCREIFCREWLTQEGDWLERLDAAHLQFLRDLLDINN